MTGIEKSEDKFLAGTASSLAVYNLKGLFTGKPKQGASVYLTISPKAQAAAYKALAAMGKPAAAVAIDPRTGAILAMASYPTFNPNVLATLDTSQVRQGRQADLPQPRPAAEPGDQRHVPARVDVQADHESAAFPTGKVADRTRRSPAPQSYLLPGSHTSLFNDGGAPCGNGHPTMVFALTVSCNTAFAKLGDTVGGSALHNMANAYGFNNPNLTIPLPVAREPPARP